jgi:hypothetical protein
MDGADLPEQRAVVRPPRVVRATRRLGEISHNLSVAAGEMRDALRGAKAEAGATDTECGRAELKRLIAALQAAEAAIEAAREHADHAHPVTPIGGWT